MNKPQCACYVYRTGDAMREDVTDEISFCPMHQSAPELLRACQLAGEYKGLHWKTKQVIDAAIAKATEGRE